MTNMEVWLLIGLSVALIVIGWLITLASSYSWKWVTAEAEARLWREEAAKYGGQLRNLKKLFVANFGIIKDVVSDLESVKPLNAYHVFGDEPEAEGAGANLPANPQGPAAPGW